MQQKKKRNIAEKLHKQFGHASSTKILKLIKPSGTKDKYLFYLIIETGENYSICLKKGTTETCSDIVLMDLTEVKGIKILHLIDHATHYSAAAIVKTKHKEEIAKAIFQICITLIGLSKEILSDNGGEFNTKLLGEMFTQQLHVN